MTIIGITSPHKTEAPPLIITISLSFSVKNLPVLPALLTPQTASSFVESSYLTEEKAAAAETELNLGLAAQETVVAGTEQDLGSAARTKHAKKGSILPSKDSKLSLSFNKSTERAAARSNNPPKKKKQQKRDKARESTNEVVAAGKLSVDRKYDCSVMRGPNLSPLMKSGCYSFRLGVGKFPAEMDLSEIKMRQRKKSPTPARMFPFPSDDQCDQTDKGGEGKRKKNSWGLFRGKASLGCIPPV
ncbi:hypothetical protein OIU78_005667 [Salix suchowensis]|nr:hypothetical protein OIU78_005667 [Salix suchowensis]